MNTSCFLLDRVKHFQLLNIAVMKLMRPLSKREACTDQQKEILYTVHTYSFLLLLHKKRLLLILYNEDWRTLVKSIDIYYKNLIYQKVNEKRRKLSEIDFLIAQYIKKKSVANAAEDWDKLRFIKNIL